MPISDQMVSMYEHCKPQTIECGDVQVLCIENGIEYFAEINSFSLASVQCR